MLAHENEPAPDVIASLESPNKELASRDRRLPGPVKIGVLLAALISIWLLFRGALVNGISYDEPIHFDHFVRFGATFELDPTGQYGLLFWVFGHLLNVAFGLASFGHPEDSVEAYQMRHLVVAFLTLFGTIAVVCVVRMFTHSWWWAAASGATLLSTPIWLGHGMFNPKDIPTAVGFSVFVLGVALMLRGISLTLGKPRAWRIWGGQIVTLLGTLIAVGGGRPSVALPMGLVGLFMGAAFLFASSSRGKDSLRAVLRQVIVSAILHSTVLTLFFLLFRFLNPVFYDSVLSLTFANLELLRNFDWNGEVWMLGQPIGVPRPWWYVTVFLIFQLPIAVLFPVLFFIGVGVRQALVKQRPHSLLFLQPLPGEPVQFAIAAGLFAQLLATPIAIALFDLNIYDGLRHVLFIIPAAVSLSTIAMWGSWKKASKRSRSALQVGFLASLAYLQFTNVQIFPYNYAFYNPLASAGAIDKTWETDYWHLSFREAIGKIPAGAPIICGFWPTPIQEGAEIPAPCREIRPFLDGASAGREEALNYWLVMSQRNVVAAERGGLLHGRVNEVPPHCQLKDSVSRIVHGQNVTMSFIYDCRISRP